MHIDFVNVFLFSIFLSILIIRLTVSLMYAFNLADKPDDLHKLHDMHIPFAGGIGILAVISYVFFIVINHYPEYLHKYTVLVACSILIFTTGFVDDAIKLSYKLRFLIQAIIALIMILVGEAELKELGALLLGFPLHLGVFSVVFTLIAIIGGINALNMIDGVDGLSGSVALASLLLIGVVAYIGQDQHNLVLVSALVGGVIGFLYFNLRHLYQQRARVFLGDNGSMLLGLMFAWLLVDLSQKSNPSMTPVTAIWLFAVPLMDMFGVMLRRIYAGQSPFTPDRQHLHHLLMRLGFKVDEIVFTMVFLHSLIGVTGLIGMYLGVPEFAMLLGFIVLCILYFYLTYKPSKFIYTMRCFQILLATRLGFAAASNSKALIGSYTKEETESIAKIIFDEMNSEKDYWLRVVKKPSGSDVTREHYAILLFFLIDNKDRRAFQETISLSAASLQRKFIQSHRIHLHRLSNCENDFDTDIHADGNVFEESETKNRRSQKSQTISFEVVF